MNAIHYLKSSRGIGAGKRSDQTERAPGLTSPLAEVNGCVIKDVGAVARKLGEISCGAS